MHHKFNGFCVHVCVSDGKGKEFAKTCFHNSRVHKEGILACPSWKASRIHHTEKESENTNVITDLLMSYCLSKTTKIATSFGCLISLEVPRSGTSASPEKVLRPTPEVLKLLLRPIWAEFSLPGNWATLHCVLCPERQCTSWHLVEL